MLGEMGGKEANHKFLEIDAAAKIIISSGYPSNPIMSEYEKYGFSAVVTKLYDIDNLRFRRVAWVMRVKWVSEQDATELMGRRVEGIGGGTALDIKEPLQNFLIDPIDKLFLL